MGNLAGEGSTRDGPGGAGRRPRPRRAAAVSLAIGTALSALLLLAGGLATTAPGRPVLLTVVASVLSTVVVGSAFVVLALAGSVLARVLCGAFCLLAAAQPVLPLLARGVPVQSVVQSLVLAAPTVLAYLVALVLLAVPATSRSPRREPGARPAR